MESGSKLRVVGIGFKAFHFNVTPHRVRNVKSHIVVKVYGYFRFGKLIAVSNFVAEPFAEIESGAVPTVVHRIRKLFGFGAFCKYLIKRLYVVFGKFRFIII